MSRLKCIFRVSALLVALLAVGCPSATVPDVRGLLLADAAAGLSQAGLSQGSVVEEFSAQYSAGHVIRQTPEAGSAITITSKHAVDLVISRGTAPVAVPNLSGLTQQQAKEALFAAGLTIGAVTTAFDETVPDGLVVSQTPGAASEAAPGLAVAIAVSKGPETVTVPNLTGQIQADAEAALTAAGLEVGAVSQEYSDACPLGAVSGQAPSPGAQVAPGSAVALTISQGPAPRMVPLVVSMTLAQATSAVQFAGLTIGAITETWSEVMPEGRVVTQSLDAGSLLPYATPIDLVVSKGREPIPVPDLAGMSQADAQSALLALGLVLGAVTEEYTPSLPVGTISNQDPQPGVALFRGDAVSLVLALDKRPIRTIEQLQSIGSGPDFPADGDYLLMNDLHASGQFSRIMTAFAGTLDGAGHAIFGLSLHVEPGNAGGAILALFEGVAESGVVHDVNIKGLATNAFFGAGIAFQNRGIISHCTLDGSIYGCNAAGIVVVNFEGGVVSHCSFTGTEYNELEGAGIALRNSGVVADCSSDGWIEAEGPVGGIVSDNWGIVRDCTVQGDLVGDSNIGGVVGVNEARASVVSCHSNCIIKASYMGAGGVAGSNKGDIGRCSAYGSVSNGWDLGGLCGLNSGSITLSYSTCSLYGRNLVGGLAGSNSGTIEDSFATGRLKGMQACEGICGENKGAIKRCYSTSLVQLTLESPEPIDNNTGTAEESFWVPELSGQNSSHGGTAISIAQLLDPQTFKSAGWNYSASGPDEAVWTQVAGQTVPYLKWSAQPGVTCSLQVYGENGEASSMPTAGAYVPWTLIQAAHAPASAYAFTGWSDGRFFDGELLKIEIFHTVLWEDTTITAAFLPPVVLIDSIEELQRIGHDPLYPLSWSYELTQDLDASSTQTWNNDAGFSPIGSEWMPFNGSFDGGCHTIANLYISRLHSANCGLFGVINETGTVDNLNLIDCDVAGLRHVGALAGWNKGYITNCHTSGDVWGSAAGGLTGHNGDELNFKALFEFPGEIRRCSSSCAVSGTVSYSGDLGGLVGYNTALIDQSFATGNVDANNTVGGLVGESQVGTITNCYASGNVSGSYTIGGFVGSLIWATDISNCFSTGTVTGEDAARSGGFAGESAASTAKQCFWDTDTSGFPTDPTATGKTTPEMMSAATFTGWDFTNVWDIQEGQSYPFLRTAPDCE